jgi:hypothetical protein
MPRLAAHLTIVGILGAFLGTSLTGVARAIELRTTSGDRTIIRNVSTASWVERADESDEQVTSPLPDLEPEELETVDFGWDSMEYDPGHGIGPGCQAGSGCQVGVACCDPVCAERFWVELDFLLWWREGRDFPALVTGAPGTLSDPPSPVLFGGEQLSEQARPGGRLQFGIWLDDCQCLGAGGRFVSIGDARTQFELVGSPGDGQFFARPFFNSQLNQTNALVVHNGDTTIGTLDLVTESEFMTADAFLRCLVARTGCSRLDFLFGYQFGRLDESLVINAVTTPSTPLLAVTDAFATQNEFHGGHFGIQGQYLWGIFGLEMIARFGFGNMHQEAALEGNSNGQNPNSGLLVQQPTNAGTYQRDVFSYMHDAGLRLVYYPTERVKLSLGYNMVFFSDVARPGDQIDTNIDGVPLASGAVHPAFSFNSTHFFAHGLNLGLECRF